LTITKLTRNDLAPDTESYQALFAQADLAHAETSSQANCSPVSSMPGAASGHSSHFAFMLVKAPEEPEYLQWLATKPVLYMNRRNALWRSLSG
jgi:Lon-like ATP-dependent protease